MSDVQQDKPKRFPWTRVLLVVSLALNLLIVGAMATFFFANSGPREFSRRPPPDGPFLYLRAFSQEDRRALGREFFKNSKPSPEMRELALQDYQDVVDLLKQPEFNQAELTSVLDRQHQRSKSLQERGRQMMVEYLGTKTPAERAAYADRLAEEVSEFRSRGKKGDRYGPKP
ncbi:MAG: periplasmic heavy metal sensor [Pseudomonadota bacterium]|nr:periplasmic heavy metal sensor [Pseudomonadota bacterium]MEC8580706.1 periplasmic heavy metal sensor [Pseudomonadota bacterium]